MSNDEGPGVIKSLLFAQRGAATARYTVLFAMLLAAAPAATLAQGTHAASFPVGMRQLEYIDAHGGGRHLALTVFYPAIGSPAAARFVMPFFANLTLYNDAEPTFDGIKRPLVMFSHGRGSNGLYYAWFGEFLASRGYIVAALNHYRANTYDATIAYLANKLWQRPRDIALTISFLLDDPFWGKLIDASRIGVAGHSQGGFTALWVGGARVDPEKYLAFQQGWRNNPMVPEHLRNELPLDATPVLDDTTSASRPYLRWRPELSRPSAWMQTGCGNSRFRPTSRSAPATPRRRPRTTPSSPPGTLHTPSLTCCRAESTTISSSTSATRRGKTNFPRPASTLLASIATRSMRGSAGRR
jgi:Platelet-activating factor acetylhydrolase, isoform II